MSAVRLNDQAQPRWPALFRHRAVWLSGLALLLYAWPALRVVQLSPDAVEYIDIARRLVAGDGYQLGVKAYHFGGTDVLHDGLSERAPLYPLLVAALFGLGVGLPGIQLVNAVLAAASVALVCGLGCELFGRRAGTLAGLLAATSPVMLVRMVPPMTEALAISLTLVATWLVVRYGGRGRIDAFLLAGAALGLGYLARPTTAVLVPALALGALVAAQRRREAFVQIAVLVLGAALFAVPMVLYSMATRGSPSYSGQSYLYAVLRTSDVQRNGYSVPLRAPIEFVSQNGPAVLATIGENVADYARLLFLDRDWLLLLVPGLALALIALARRRYPRSVAPVLSLASANFLIYALTWAAYSERYQLLTLLLLLPFAVDGLDRLGLGRLAPPAWPAFSALHAAVLVVALTWSASFIREYRGEFRYGDEPVRTRTDRGIRWTGPPRWVQDNELSRMIDWINARTDRGDVLAHGQPWPLTFFTNRPATLLPIKLSPERLRSFLIEDRVAGALLDIRDVDRRGYLPILENLTAEGVRMTTVGSHRIFDARALWSVQQATPGLWRLASRAPDRGGAS